MLKVKAMLICCLIISCPPPTLSGWQAADCPNESVAKMIGFILKPVVGVAKRIAQIHVSCNKQNGDFSGRTRGFTTLEKNEVEQYQGCPNENGYPNGYRIYGFNWGGKRYVTCIIFTCTVGNDLVIGSVVDGSFMIRRWDCGRNQVISSVGVKNNGRNHFSDIHFGCGERTPKN